MEISFMFALLLHRYVCNVIMQTILMSLKIGLIFFRKEYVLVSFNARNLTYLCTKAFYFIQPQKKIARHVPVNQNDRMSIKTFTESNEGCDMLQRIIQQCLKGKLSLTNSRPDPEGSHTEFRPWIPLPGWQPSGG